MERWRRFGRRFGRGRGGGERVCARRREEFKLRVHNIREGASFLPLFVRIMLFVYCHERVVLLS